MTLTPEKHSRSIGFRALIGLFAVTLLSACAEDEGAAIVGTLERDRIELVLESNEPIIRISLEDGTPVSAGDLILEQDTTRHRARLAQTLAERDQAAARLAELRRGPREEDIEKARAEVRATEALVRNAKINLEREQELVDLGLGEEQSRDLRQATFDDLTAQLAARRQALERLLNGTTVEELDQAEAQLAALEAVVAQAELDLDRLSLIAPVDGLLDRIHFQVGERPIPGQTVAVILDSSRSFARVYVPEPLRAQMVPGVTVTVLADGVSQPLTGTVRWVSSDASFTPYFALTEHDRSRLAYLAEIDLPDAGDLPSGLPLEVTSP